MVYGTKGMSELVEVKVLAGYDSRALMLRTHSTSYWSS